MAAVKPAAPTGEPRVLPVAVRGVMIRDPKKARPSRPGAVAWSKPAGPAPRPRHFIVLAEPPAAEHYDENKPPFLDVSLIGNTRDSRVTREALVYCDDASPSDIAASEEYVRARSERRAVPVGNGKIQECFVWRGDDRAASPFGVRVSSMPRDDFRKLFLSRANLHRYLVIAFALPRAAAHIAAEFHEVVRGERFVKGWKLLLREPPEGGWGKRTPPTIRVKQLASGGAIRIDLTGCGPSDLEEGESEEAGWHRGQFLSLERLAYALSAEEHTLASAVAAFTGEVLDEGTGDPTDASDAMDRHRRRADATLSLAETLTGLFDLLPQSRARGGNLSETRVNSPAALSRALAKMIGYGAPRVPRERQGAASAALFGARIETDWRGIVPIASLDISKDYAMIAALAGLPDYMAAAEIRFEEATAEAREIVSSTTAADILQPAIWPRFAILCWCRLSGEVVPVHALFDGRQFSMGMPERWSDGLVPLLLPDFLGAKLKGRAPEIVRAERMVLFGRRRPLRCQRLPSGVVFDPSRDNLFCTLVEEGERLRRGDGRWGSVPSPVREVLYPGWKAGNNGLAFGSFAQTNVIDKAGEAREEVTERFDEGELRVQTPHPEEHGTFFCPPLAGLVTACGRLLLAVIDELVDQKGGIVAAGHTDSAHIIATPTGGPVRLEVVDRDPQSGVGRRYWREVHALSSADIEEIAAAFEPLNIFDRALMPGSPLKVKGWGRALFLTASHYCFLDEAGEPIDGTRSVLAQYLPPVGDAATWPIEGWRYVAADWEHRVKGPPPPWLSYPAVCALALSRPSFRDKVATVAPRPFDRFLVARALGRQDGEPEKTAVIIAPFESTPDRWPSLPWRFYETGELVDWEKPDSDGWEWRFVTIGDVLHSFARIHPHAMLDAAGMPCDGDTRGPLRRMAMRDGPKYVSGKEILEWSDDPAFAFTTPAPAVFPIASAAGDPVDECDWDVVRRGLAVIGAPAVARHMNLDPRSVRYWLEGSGRPRSARAVAKAVVACAAEIGLLLPDDGALDVQAVCACLPERAAMVQHFLGAAVELLAQSHKGMRELARAMSVSESTLRDWRNLCDVVRPRSAKQLRLIAARIALFARGEIRRARRRFSFDAKLIGDMQQIHVAMLLSLGDPKAAVLPAERLYGAIAQLFAHGAPAQRSLHPLWYKNEDLNAGDSS